MLTKKGGVPPVHEMAVGSQVTMDAGVLTVKLLFWATAAAAKARATAKNFMVNKECAVGLEGRETSDF